MQSAISDKERQFCSKLNIPTTDLSTQDRLRSLMAFRNEWKLYPRKCDATGKQILSAYAPDSPFKVFNNSYWWSDKWDALDYGKDYDFNKPFFEQFKELQREVPREGTTIFNSENCEFNSHIRESKNCYLNSLVYRCEDICYTCWATFDKDVFDSNLINNSTLCYFCSNVNKAYNCVMLEESQNCNDCFFSYQLKGCDNCIFSSNLANKSYYAFNKPCTKEEFKLIKEKYINGSWQSFKQALSDYRQMRKDTIHRYAHALNCENIVGDHLYDSKNCINCFNGFSSEDCYDSASLDRSKDIYGCYSAGWPDCESVYTSLVTRGSKSIYFCNYTWFSNNLWYCDSNNSCENCFGCIGLRHKKYCILNKQYSEDEYKNLMPKIISHMKSTGEWGKFFPKSIYPFAYNESAAQEFFPLDKETAIEQGWRWRDEDIREWSSAITTVPDNIKDVSDEFIKEILKCEECDKNFKMIAQEIKFYTKMDLPIPRSCPTCRHKAIFNLVNPINIYKRECSKCTAPIQTTYAPTRPEKVYCEECYLKEVY